MLYLTVAEYEKAIASTQEALQRVLLMGIESENSSGGSSRRMKDSTLKDLRDHLAILVKEYKSLGGNNVVFTEAGW